MKIKNAQRQGFTLLEMLVVIILIGILAGLGISNYSKTKEAALGKEAKANLKLIGAAERIWKMESPSPFSYTDCICDDVTTCNRTTGTPPGCNYLLRLALTASNWTYGVAVSGSGATAAFTATATRPGTGGYLDCSYTYTNINLSDGVDPVPSSTTNCP